MTSQRRGPRQAKPVLGWSTAWKRVLADAQDDILPDPIDYADYRHNAAPHIERTRRMFREGFHSRDLLRIDAPKRGFTLRPGTTLLIEDRLVYQALVDKFAESVDRRLESERVVCGYRVRKGGGSRRLFKHGITMWLRFQEMVRSGYQQVGYTYLLNTDLVAYFDHINHTILQEQLRTFGVKDNILRPLFDLLKRWETSHNMGIPQGQDPSSFLGNIYLDPVDKAMIREGYRYFRYVDDIYVFGRSELELRRALTLLIQELRKLGLHLQEAKTSILKGDDVLSTVDERKDELQAIDYALAVGDTRMALDEVKTVLKEITRSKSKFNERHFRKCLNELRKLGSDRAVQLCLSRFDMLPHAAREMGQYLALFINRKRVQRALVAFLQDRDRNIYPWQEIWFLWALKQARGLPREFLNFCRSQLQNHPYWASRANYALVLGSAGDAADIALIDSRFDACSNLVEKRAFIYAMKRMQVNRRNSRFEQLVAGEPLLEGTVKYVTDTA
jgi:hypothetical protein